MIGHKAFVGKPKAANAKNKRTVVRCGVKLRSGATKAVDLHKLAPTSQCIDQMNEPKKKSIK